MPVYDHLCECGHITEAIMPVDVEATDCAKCGKRSVRIISCSGQNCANEDAAWIRSVLEVVDHSSTERHTREFISNPTRENYRRWMKGEGLRHLESGEKQRREKPDMNKIHREVMQRAVERRRIEI
jgi:hypothetical protein